MLFSHYGGEGDGEGDGDGGESGNLTCLGMRCVTGNCFDGIVCTPMCLIDTVAKGGCVCVNWELILVWKGAGVVGLPAASEDDEVVEVVDVAEESEEVEDVVDVEITEPSSSSSC